jgi:putative phosphoribosyl transferase
MTPLRIPVGPATLDADLSRPAGARGLVLFAHGSGSSRFSPRNRHVARVLNEAFDIGMLAERLVEEPGTLDAVAALARDWFARHLSRRE